MNFIPLLTLFVVVTARNFSSDPRLDEHWANFKRYYRKTYPRRDVEMTRRYIWERNVAQINHYNLKADVGLYNYKRGLNEYSDLTQDEFVRYLTGYYRPSNYQSNAIMWNPPSDVNMPCKVDWRDEGFVTPVKDQFFCGACWAFSAAGSLEGQQKNKTGKLVSLSEQNLVDCAKEDGNMGCTSGFMESAFEYVKKNYGINTEDSYPFTASEGTCSFNKANIGATCTGYYDIPFGDEDALRKAVAMIGPISVAMDASRQSLHQYKSGIYDDPECSSEDMNHAVLLVGYGTEDGMNYWLAKNSWGLTWGMRGFFKLARNKKNLCGFATQASFPVV